MVQFRLDVRFASALWVVVAVVAWLALSGLVSAASRPLGWLVASGTVAILLSPLVELFERHWPHWLAIVASILLVVIVLGGAWVAVSATLADNVDELRTEAPAAAAELEDEYAVVADFELERRVTDFVDELDERFGTRAQVERTISTAPTYVVTGMLMLFLLIYGPRFVSGGLAQIDDPRRRARIADVLQRTLVRGRGYLLLALARVAVTTLVAWAVFVVVGLEASFLLGLLVGVFSLVPYIGMLLGGLPALLIGAASGGADVAAVVAMLVLALQLVDGLFVQPRIEALTIHVGPALPLIVALVGWEIYGPGGAVYSIALLVMLLALASAVSTEDEAAPVAATDDVAARVPDPAG